MRPTLLPAVFLLLLASAALPVSAILAQQPAPQPAPEPTTAAQAPTRDTSYIDAEGTAHVTRVVPLPATISPQAQHSLGRQAPDAGPPQSLADRRKDNDAFSARGRVAWAKLCPVQIAEDTISGVPVHIVTPDAMPAANGDKVLIDLHGGGFNADSGSYTESIPIASYTGIKVVAVLYRLAPEHPFPAAVDDSIAVYKSLLKTHKPDHIVIYGTSAGAILTGEVAVRIKQLGLPMPAALGIFSGLGDFARAGDSAAIFSLGGLSGALKPPVAPLDAEYIASTDPHNPVLSPVYADLHGLPPTLFVTSERDMLLSGTANLERAFLEAGVDAHLIVFDALTHAFWYNPALPEGQEANHMMAEFFVKHLAK